LKKNLPTSVRKVCKFVIRLYSTDLGGRRTLQHHASRRPTLGRHRQGSRHMELGSILRYV